MSDEITKYRWSKGGMLSEGAPTFVGYWVRAETLTAQAEKHDESDRLIATLVDRQAAELATLKQEVEDLKEALYPFGLYATALKGREPMNTVHRIRHQGITVGAFQEAREVLKLDETLNKETK